MSLYFWYISQTTSLFNIQTYNMWCVKDDHLENICTYKINTLLFKLGEIIQMWMRIMHECDS